jgi:hypothetical protein
VHGVEPHQGLLAELGFPETAEGIAGVRVLAAPESASRPGELNTQSDVRVVACPQRGRRRAEHTRGFVETAKVDQRDACQRPDGQQRARFRASLAVVARRVEHRDRVAWPSPFE